MTPTTFLMLGIFLVACLLLVSLVCLWASSEERNFKLSVQVSELSAENGELIRLADSLKSISSHQDLMIRSYARGWQRTGDYTPDLLASRLHVSLQRRHLQLVAMEETRPVPVPAIAEAI